MFLVIQKYISKLQLTVWSSSLSPGDVGPLLCVNRSRRPPLPPYRTTDTGQNWTEKDRCWCRCDMCQFLARTGMRSRWRPCIYLCHRGLTEVTSSVRHLLNAPPLQANNALLILPAEISWLSPPCQPSIFVLHPSSSDWFKIMVALLSVSPAWLTPLALVGSPVWHTAPLTHLVTSDPSTWLSWLLVCRVSSVVYYLIVLMSYISPLWHTVTSFLPLYMSDTPSLSREAHVQHF